MGRMWSDTLAGKVLIASPSIGDPRFARSVIYLCAHTDEHAMGFVLNKPKGALKLPDLLTQLGIECTIEVPARPVLDGGPCDQERGFVLHSDDYQSRDATLEVGEGLRLTATRDVLEAIAHHHGPRRAVLALGHAGWGAGQLEQELLENAWLVGEPDFGLLFGQDNASKWTRALARIGVDPARLSAVAGHA